MNSNRLSPSLQRLADAPIGYVSDPTLDSQLANRKWTEALEVIELKIAETSDSAQLRILWVRCQLELANVPPAALSAPIEETITAIESDNSLHPLAVGTLLKLSCTLLEKNQSRLALIMLEYCFKFIKQSSSLSKQEQIELDAYFTEALKKEISNAKERRDNTSYLTSLETKLAQQQKPKSNFDHPSKYEQTQNNSKSLSAKTIFASEVLINQDSNLKPEDYNNHKKNNSFRLWQRINQGSLQKYFLILTGSISTVIALFIVWQNLIQTNFLNQTAYKTSFYSSPPARLEGPLPVLPTQNPDTLQNQLASLSSNLDQVGERLKKIGITATDNNGDRTTKTIEELSKDPDVDQSALNAKAGKEFKPSSEKHNNPPDINNKNNSEPDELVTLEGEKHQTDKNIDPNKIPYLDPTELAKMPMDIIQNTMRRAIVRGLGNDQNPSNPYPPVLDPGNIPYDLESRRSLDGRPLRSYPVDEFQPPLVYKTIVATEVLSAPSVLAETVTHLESNTTIQVVSRMGQWLELRSAGGRRGYIYAQDAVAAGN